MEGMLSTNQRIRILKCVIYETERISVSGMAQRLRLSKGLVSKYFTILLKNGVLRRAGEKFLVVDSPGVKGMKIMLNLRSIKQSVFRKYRFVRAVGMYGSCAKGENTKDSDMDLWVRVGDADEAELAALSADLRKHIRSVKPLYLSDEKIRKLKLEDELFYHSLVFGSITLIGEKDGLQL